MSFYHFVIKTVPRDGSPVKKLKLSLTNSMLLRSALLLVGSKCTAGRAKRSDDDDDKSFGRPKRSDDDDDKSSDDDDTSPGEVFVSRIMAVGCNGYCLMESLDFPLEDLDSSMTPMTGKTAKEIDVELGPLQTPAPSLSRPRRNAFDMLLAAPLPTFLPVFAVDESESQPPSGTIQEQLCGAVPAFYEEIRLGFYDPATEVLLQTNLNKISDILCFINGHWGALFRGLKEPEESSKLLRLAKASFRSKP
jgi:hypothetical protein